MKSKLLIIFGIIALAFFMFTITKEGGISNIKSPGILVILVVMLINIFNIFLKSIRWRWLVHRLTGVRISVWFSMQSIFAGVAGGSILPGRVEVTKPLLLKNDYGVSLTKSLPALMLERILDLSAVMMVFLVTFFLVPSMILLGDANWKLLTVLLILLVIVLSCFCLFPKKFILLFKRIISMLPLSFKLKEKIFELVENSIDSLTILKTKGYFFLNIFSLVILFIQISVLYLFALSLNINITPIQTAFVFCASLIIGIITLIPGGTGVTEISGSEIMHYLIPIVSLSAVRSAVLFDRLFSYYLIVVIGSIILIGKRKKKEIHPNSQTL